MAIKVGINGFGRIGRLCIRILMERSDEFDLCAVNLRKSDIPHMAYLLKYDSAMGRFPGTVKEGKDYLEINGKKVHVFSYDDPGQIPWAEKGAEYIIESTGVFNSYDKAIVHQNGGAKKIILTGPAKDKETPMYVMGVNHKTYKTKYDVVSNASCTTNCLAPMVKVVNDAFGIEEGLMTTVHASTSKQETVDARAGSDWRIGRSVYENIIPSTTGAAKAVGKVIPDVEGKLTGLSLRIPAVDGSLVDLTCRLKTATTYEEICKAMQKASKGSMKGIINYCEDPIVSKDILGQSCTCVFDVQAGIMLNEKFVKLIAWYDNEWGYSNKVVDLVKHVADTCAKEEARKAAKKAK
jgi:glyceraldehyde 3-phosphate dehydrogenase